MKTVYMKQAHLDMSIEPVAKVSHEVWRWGGDNLLPLALSSLARSSVTHRRIVIDKADYISGRGFKCDSPRLSAFVEHCNGLGQSLRAIVQRLAFDKCLFGNGFIEVVRSSDGRKVALFHQDASRVRVAKDRVHVVLHHDWSKFRISEAKQLPIYPLFEKQKDNTYRSMIHYKDYEPMFENYGSPKYLAALGAIAIAYKTDQWNITRLDNAFQPSGVMVLDGTVESTDEAAEIARTAEAKFAGNPGQVMFIVKNSADGDTTKFVPITTSSDGDWRQLHEQSTADVIVAHSWFRTLSGLEYVSGFSADRVQNEYNIALSTIIRTEQQELLEPLRRIFADIFSLEEAMSIEFVNLPPFESKPSYMRVWEARKADGLDYDQTDKEQQVFLGA